MITDKLIERAKAALEKLEDMTPIAGLVAEFDLRKMSIDLARALIREREAAERLAELLEEVQRQGCEVCNGDCSSAMPPVGYCPPRVRMEALAAYRKATKETDDV